MAGASPPPPAPLPPSAAARCLSSLRVARREHRIPKILSLRPSAGRLSGCLQQKKSRTPFLNEGREALQEHGHHGRVEICPNRYSLQVHLVLHRHRRLLTRLALHKRRYIVSQKGRDAGQVGRVNSAEPRDSDRSSRLLLGAAGSCGLHARKDALERPLTNAGFAEGHMKGALHTSSGSS